MRASRRILFVARLIASSLESPILSHRENTIVHFFQPCSRICVCVNVAYRSSYSLTSALQFSHRVSDRYVSTITHRLWKTIDAMRLFKRLCKVRHTEFRTLIILRKTIYHTKILLIKIYIFCKKNKKRQFTDSLFFEEYF